MEKLDHAAIAEKLKYPKNKVDIVIDTDAYNEVDDQFAIVWALKSTERINVKALYAAPFCSKAIQKLLPLPDETLEQFAHYAWSPAEGMERSYEEILNLLSILDLPAENRVFRGSDHYLESYSKPVQSEAAKDLVERAMNSEQLYVIAIGAVTNVASAILMEPRIIDRIKVIWLGGQPLHFKSAAEFNLMQDIKASQLLFNCGVPLVLIPCIGVASHLTMTKDELSSRLFGKSVIGNYLGKIVMNTFHDESISQSDRMIKPFYLRGMDDVPEEIANAFVAKNISWSRIIWDISTVSYLVNPNWSASTLTPSPILTDNMSWKFDPSRHPIRVCHYLSRDHIFGDMFSKFEQV
jgi:hypothetical protein